MLSLVLFSLCISGFLADLACPPGGLLSSNRNACFHIIPVALDHHNANLTCRSFGGFLAEVDNKNDALLLAEVQNVLKINLDLLKTTFWVNPSAASQNCSHLNAANGRIENGNCSSQAPFVCEIPFKTTKDQNIAESTAVDNGRTPALFSTAPHSTSGNSDKSTVMSRPTQQPSTTTVGSKQTSTSTPLAITPATTRVTAPPTSTKNSIGPNDPNSSYYWTTTYGNHSYRLEAYARTWNDSELYCNTIGGHLVSIADYNEINFVLSLFKTGPYYLWIGGYMTHEREYLWTDKSASKFLNLKIDWTRVGPPYCVLMNQRGEWRPEDCNGYCPSMCKK